MLVRGPLHKLGQLYHETKLSDGTLVVGDYQRLEFAVADFNSLDQVSELQASLKTSLVNDLDE